MEHISLCVIALANYETIKQDIINYRTFHFPLKGKGYTFMGGVSVKLSCPPAEKGSAFPLGTNSFLFDQTSKQDKL